MGTFDDLEKSARASVVHGQLGALHDGRRAAAKKEQVLSESVSIAREEGRQARRESLSLQEENLDLTVANRKLKDEAQQLNEVVTTARDLIQEMAMRNESFARTILHLRKQWAPSKDDEIKQILATKKQEVQNDEPYKKHVQAELDRQVPRRPSRR